MSGSICHLPNGLGGVGGGESGAGVVVGRQRGGGVIFWERWHCLNDGTPCIQLKIFKVPTETGKPGK